MWHGIGAFVLITDPFWRSLCNDYCLVISSNV